MGKSATNSVSRALTDAREERLIPWEWIVDESREAETAGRWSSASALIKASVDQYRRDYWQDQPYRVEVWSEKGTVRGTLRKILHDYGVTFRVMHGYASATVVNDIAELSISSAKPLIALYVGDWDPSGKHMSDVDLPNRLDQYGAEITVRRVALLAEDLKSLPASFPLASKRQDPRYKWFRANVGRVCYELDAMPPPDLRARVESEIRRYIDGDAWDHALFVEGVEIDSYRDFSKSWLASISSP